MTDRRERPWRKLRVIVEVTVPPNNRSTEKDLVYHVVENMPLTVPMARKLHRDHYEARVRVKSFANFWPAFLRLERGLKVNFRKKADDQYKGL